MPYKDDNLPAPSAGKTVPTVTRGIHIHGDIKGNGDLLIEGQVTGSVFLPDNQVLIGGGSDVHANIVARIIDVEGTVVGDLTAVDHVVIRSSSVVEGNITAPQIQLDEGCQFKGSVRMREPDVSQQPPTKPRVEGHAGDVRFQTANG